MRTSQVGHYGLSSKWHRALLALTLLGLLGCGAQPNTDLEPVDKLTRLMISPATVSVRPSATVNFSGSGGTPPYTFNLLNGDGSFQNASGDFLSAARPGSTLVQLSDSVGATATASVQVVGPVQFATSEWIVGTQSETQLQVVGGASPYRFRLVSGVGTVDSSRGIYSAGAISGVATVEVSDALGQTATIHLTINLSLSISPAQLSVVASGSASFSGGGGTPPYTFSISSGSGSVDPKSGTFQAPAAAGQVIVRLQDALGAEASAVISVVGPVQIDPSDTMMAVNNVKTFVASGGQTPYHFLVLTGGGSIGADSGVFAAPGLSSVVMIQVIDALSQTAEARVQVNSAVTLAPATATVKPSSTLTLTAAGGVPPYLYSVVSGGGSITSSSGVFTAPATPGNIAVKVSDSLGNSAVSTISVLGPLVLAPVNFTLAVNNHKQWGATGGVPPYAYSLKSGTGSMDAVSGEYVAPSVPGAAVLQVVDQLGQISTATVQTQPALEMQASAAFLNPGGNCTFTSRGGVPPYVYSILRGAGSIQSASGVFSAGSLAGSTSVQVSDAIGNKVSQSILVATQVAIHPATITLAVNNQYSLSADGGAPPYLYSIVSGSGQIDSVTGLFTASNVAGSSVVQVSDSLGQVSQSHIVVGIGLSISPLSATVVQSGRLTFTASGGVPPYAYAVVAGSGSIGSSTGLFVAPNQPGPVTIQVTDHLANATLATVNVAPDLRLTPTSVNMAAGAQFTFSASGGQPPYSYFVRSGGGTIDAATGVYQAPGAAGSASIQVVDSLGQSVQALISISAALTLSSAQNLIVPNATLAFVASGGLAPYAYSVIRGGGSIDAATGQYTASGSAGDVVIQVQDANASVAVKTVTVVAPLIVTPPHATLAVGNSLGLVASGGLKPYAFTLLSGVGSVDSTNGLFTASNDIGRALVRVTDSLGQVVNVDVMVNAALTLAPSSLALPENASQTFTAEGGVAPYTYSLSQGQGTLQSSSGFYLAPSQAGLAQIQATDSLGNKALAQVQIVAPPGLSPASATLGFGQTQTFAVRDGWPPFVFSLLDGPGSIDTQSGVFTAGNTPGTAHIRVVDSLGQTVQAQILISSQSALHK